MNRKAKLFDLVLNDSNQDYLDNIIPKYEERKYTND